MRKMKIILIAGLIFGLMAAYAYAASTITTANSPFALGGTSITFSPSTNVTVIAVASNGTGSRYAATSKHTQGDKEYGATSESTKIYVNSIGVSGTQLSPSGSGSDNFTSTGWSSL